MKWRIGIAVMILGGIIGGLWWYINSTDKIAFLSPLSDQTPKEKPLDKYTFENLRSAQIPASIIRFERIIKEEDGYTSHLFSYQVDGKKITGQLNLPIRESFQERFPTILMIRGFIDPATYKTGDGTRRAAAVFAQNGYVTIAPDLLGYGESDPPDNNTITARLIRPYEILVLLKSLPSFSNIDNSKVGLWAHSNGGQIALSVLEITGRQIPTTLWAPVSKPFPYNILFYTDEYEDYGKEMRRVIAEFEQDYDVDKYSLHAYYDWIQAPLQIHQGTADDAVPIEWTDELVKKLKSLDKEVKLYTYPGADHNLQPSWNTVIQRDIAFFRQNL